MVSRDNAVSGAAHIVCGACLRKYPRPSLPPRGRFTCRCGNAVFIRDPWESARDILRLSPDPEAERDAVERLRKAWREGTFWAAIGRSAAGQRKPAGGSGRDGTKVARRSSAVGTNGSSSAPRQTSTGSSRPQPIRVPVIPYEPERKAGAGESGADRPAGDLDRGSAALPAVSGPPMAPRQASGPGGPRTEARQTGIRRKPPDTGSWREDRGSKIAEASEGGGRTSEILRAPAFLFVAVGTVVGLAAKLLLGAAKIALTGAVRLLVSLWFFLFARDGNLFLLAWHAWKRAGAALVPPPPSPGRPLAS